MRAARPMLAAAAGLLCWAPAVALACPVCFSTKSKAQEVAYLATTGLMTALPLLVLGGAVWWLRRRMTELSRPVAPPPQGKGPALAGQSTRPGDADVVPRPRTSSL